MSADRDRAATGRDREPRSLAWRLVAMLGGCVARLPFSVQHALGRVIGALGFLLAGRRRSIARRNLEQCFPDLTANERERLVRANFRETGLAVVETALAWYRDPRDFHGRVQFEGLHHLDAATRSGRGVLLIGCHMLTLEIAGALLASIRPLDVMYRAHADPSFDAEQLAGRARHYDAVVDRQDLRQAIRRLRDGHVLWYAADQDYGPRYSVFAPFFGVPAATIVAGSRFARAGRAHVMFIDHWRNRDSLRWHLRISAPWSNYPTGDATGDALRINQAVEAAVREHADQYLWTHRRFKTRPPGAPAIYSR